MRFDGTGGFKCADPRQTAPKTCPTGFTLDAMSGRCSKTEGAGTTSFEAQCPNSNIEYIELEGVCQKLVAPTCPMGTPMAIITKGADGKPVFPQKGVCIPNTTATYTRPMPTSHDAPWPCDGDDPLSIVGHTEIKCYRVSATTAATSPPPVNPPFETNDAAYRQQVAEYEAMLEASIRQNDPTKLPVLRTKSEGIQATLNKMIENLTYMKKETPDIRSQRDSLLEKLRRIQQDYSAMLVNTDDLETLRRIRQQEAGAARSDLILYLFAFLFVSVMLAVYLVYVGRKTPTSATTATTPTMSPALT